MLTSIEKLVKPNMQRDSFIKGVDKTLEMNSAKSVSATVA